MKRWLAATGVVLLVAGTATAIYYFFFRHDISFSLDPVTVRPGESFAVVTTFRNTWPPYVAPTGRIAIVADAGRGRDVRLTLAGVAEQARTPLEQVQSPASDVRAKFAAQVQGVLDSGAGFIDENLHAYLRKYPRGDLPYHLNFGCPLTHNPGGRPPHIHRKLETFVVLPETQPGTYTVRVPASRYCDDRISNKAAVLRLTVTSGGGPGPP